MTERRRQGVGARLGRVFLVQIAIISAVAIGGIFATAWIVDDVLMREALSGEAEHYWTLHEANSQQPLPNTDNMRGYLASGGDLSTVPAELRDLTVGYHHANLDGQQPIVLVSERGADRLFLVFDEDGVSELSFYFGLVPLTAVLLMLYGLSWFMYRMSQRAVSPMIELARRVESYELSADRGIRLELADLEATADADVASMIRALDRFTARLSASVERERNFTRDASHELRTPLAVLNGSLDVLERDQSRPDRERETLKRMRRTVMEMRNLVETLLLLAREEELALPRESVVVNDVVTAEVAQLRELASSRCNELVVHEEVALEVRAPPKILSIVIGNLVRNALAYTRDGRVDVIIGKRGVRVADTGIGMTTEEMQRAFEPFFRGGEGRVGGSSEGGHGLGLAIVDRLATQFGWRVSVESRVGKGTTVTVSFGQGS